MSRPRPRPLTAHTDHVVTKALLRFQVQQKCVNGYELTCYAESDHYVVGVSSVSGVSLPAHSVLEDALGAGLYIGPRRNGLPIGAAQRVWLWRRAFFDATVGVLPIRLPVSRKGVVVLTTMQLVREDKD
jgi:hypothetical protein